MKLLCLLEFSNDILNNDESHVAGYRAPETKTWNKWKEIQSNKRRKKLQGSFSRLNLNNCGNRYKDGKILSFLRNTCDWWLSVVPGSILTMTENRIYRLTRAEAGRGRWASVRTVVRRTDTSGGTRPALNKAGERIGHAVSMFCPHDRKKSSTDLYLILKRLEEIRPVHSFITLTPRQAAYFLR